MARLAINVDHVATVRQARLASEPDPVTAAAMAELAGAQGIVVHLREDRRHIQDRDVEILRRTVKTNLNLEMAATPEMVQTALRLQPDMVTLVPEKRQELTTEGGLDVTLYEEALKDVLETFHKGGIAVSLFIDPDPKQIKTAHRLETDYIEIHTGSFAEAKTFQRRQEEYDRVVTAAKLAHKLGLGVHAGHGVDYQNIVWLRNISEIEEFSIGHAVIARAVLVGIDRAVREMLALVNG
ncbi:pyridoxine 5'-phosphate synthase [Desulforhabdus amnigena]|uniref:Pyridoxine 5'-phosphate synthase n=1 Tax=Desulforhabdus amnigena TaxID=40218 RepID=A0A9W6FUJ3_9BACT|nr:pyridoxine 5'-phosphate synthase [Desulforhabdus amnigena]NLJ27592.1 pyridoxine 5'-phosphate synthase [Deltaproteobacteria bacterium]GLI35117.1 pyridoxine 5'-phosphate synthase [Desulforhabdus amnigena]